MSKRDIVGAFITLRGLEVLKKARDPCRDTGNPGR